MEKTAVEWLFNVMFDSSWNKEHQMKWLEKAKEMEKQQIIDAYNDAEDKCEYFIEEHAWQRYHQLSENYYKQTFKSE